MQIVIGLLIGLMAFSCNQARTTQDKIFIPHPAAQVITSKNKQLGTPSDFLAKALKADTLEFYNDKPFLFFKSGPFLGKTDKYAIVVQCPTDTTYSISLYSIKNNNLILSDSICDLDAFPAQFDPIFQDYNFDGQTDIYIQVTASNGWSLSRGHLIIINPNTKKFELHKETRDFANMLPDIKTKTVKTELWNGYDAKDRHQLTIFTNKWIGGKLKTISKRDTTLN